VRIQLFVTDVSESAIEHARTGTYAASIESDVSAERLRRFFTKTDGSYRINKQVRDLCVFARQDLTRDPPFSRLDLVLCRNVLIYMDVVLQKKLVHVFHYALNPTGFLMLGQAETVGPQASLFKLVDKKFRIHRKRVSPANPAGAFPADYTVPGLPRRKTASDSAAVDSALQGEVSRALLERYAPAGVVVDSDMQIVQFRGQAGAFLEPAPGEASLNLLKMAREGLLYGLRTAVDASRKSRQPVRKDGLQVRSGNGWKNVTIEVIPLSSSGRPHFLVEELHGRNDELSRVNSDLVNLVGSVQIAIVMVTTDLRIRRFTPMAERVLNLIPADLDRSIGHINPNIDCPNLDQLITECIETASPLERKCRIDTGGGTRWRSGLIRPSTTRRLGSAAPDRASRTSRAGSTWTRFSSRHRSRTFGIAAGDLDGRVLDEVGGTWDLAALRGAVASLNGDSFTVNGLPARFSPHNGAPRHLSISGRVLRSIDAPNARLLLLGFADGVAPKSLA
jgi:CheR methyltransferase, SAM binding domain/PAS domain